MLRQIDKTGRWLVIKETPEQLWPQLLEFWHNSGFTVETESPQTGIMETNWAENRAKIPQDSEVELVIYPPKKSFYEIFRDPFGTDRTSTLTSLLGIGNPRVMQALAAPLQVFRRGEPLALMPNVFVR